MEAKVSFHVRRFLRECEDAGTRPSEDTVTAHLRDTYGEYQRKPAVRCVKPQVLAVIAVAHFHWLVDTFGRAL